MRKFISTVSDINYCCQYGQGKNKFSIRKTTMAWFLYVKTKPRGQRIGYLRAAGELEIAGASEAV